MGQAAASAPLIPKSLGLCKVATLAPKIQKVRGTNMQELHFSVSVEDIAKKTRSLSSIMSKDHTCWILVPNQRPRLESSFRIPLIQLLSTIKLRLGGARALHLKTGSLHD